MDSLHIGKASDLEEPGEKRLYRFFEMVQGGLSWLTFFLVILLSWLAPSVVLHFLIIFVIFWFALSVYYSIHLYSGYKRMEKHRSIDWLSKVKDLSPHTYSVGVESWRDIYHLVVLPNYKEPIGLIRESLKSISESRYPKDRMIVVLGFEQRAGEKRREVAEKLKKEFGNEFFRFLTTFHPGDIEGELKGKGANDAWATKRAKERVIDPLGIPYQNIIYSSFDIDTQVYPQYFGCVTYHYLTASKPTRTSYQPVPLYNNNIWQAPGFSQTSSFTGVFWQIVCQERPGKLVTFSSHSMSFKALVEVGFKQTNMVNEDSRIFWQCFFKYDGDYRSQPIYYPVSLDANVGRNLWQTAVQVYKQQRRWGYPENTAYFLYHSLKNKKVSFLKKIVLGVEIIGGSWNWSTASILIFSLGWLPVFFGQGLFSQSLLSYTVPKFVSRIMTFSMLGLMTSVWISTVLLPSRSAPESRYRYLLFVLSWLLVPAQLVFLSSLPALDAQTRYMLGKYMGFWVTPKNRSRGCRYS